MNPSKIRHLATTGVLEANGTARVREFLSGAVLAHIEPSGTIGASGYEVRFYNRSQVTNTNQPAPGVFFPLVDGAQPFVTWRVEARALLAWSVCE